jgi:cytochrome c oxidase subunit 1
MFGRKLDETLGKIQFWLFLIGMNLTFFPMHILGILGMPRRQYTYPPNLGWDGLNLAASLGVILLIVAVLIFLVNLVKTFAVKPAVPMPDDPWDAFTLEWATTSPPPPENFKSIPTVRSRRPLWDKKHPDQADWLVAGH